MAPKRAAAKGAAPAPDEADLTQAPESIDDRSLVITVSGSLEQRDAARPTTSQSAEVAPEAAFSAALYAPSIQLVFPQEMEAVVAAASGTPEGGVFRAEALNTAERDFHVPLFSRRLTLTPALVAQFLGGTFRVIATTLPEPTVKDPPAAAGGKGGKPAAGGAGGKAGAAGAAAAGGGKAAAGKDGAPNTGRSDGGAETIEVLNRAFTLADILVGRTNVEITCGPTPGFDTFTIKIAANAPLLSGANVVRYPAAVVRIGKVSQLPPKRVIDPQRHRQTVSGSLDDAPPAASTVSSSGAATAEQQRQAIAREHLGVRVVGRWTAGTTRLFESIRVPHASSVDVDFTAVVFLHVLPKLKVLQSLFNDNIEFEVHDRDPRDPPPQDATDPRVAPYGVASVSLRSALDGDTRFINTTQVTPCRVLTTGGMPDYYSYGTTLQTKITLTTPLPFVTFVEPPPPPRPQSAASVATEFPAPGGAESTIGGSGAASLGAFTADKGPVVEPCAKFLSRLVLVMPYKGTTTASLIAAVMGAVVEQPRPTATCDVAEVPLRRAAPAPPPTDEKGAGKGGKAGAGAGAAAEKKKGGADAADAAAAAADEAARTAALQLIASHPSGGVREQLLVAVPDNVSGFEIMDGRQRIIVIEGQMPFVARVAAVATAVAGDDSDVRILFNYELPFLRREYHVWPPLVLPIIPPSQLRREAAEHADGNGDAPALEATGNGKAGRGAAAAGAKGAKGAPAPPSSAGQTTKAGGGRPPIPPIESARSGAGAAAVAAAAAAASPAADEGELDAGGVGGRLRRIRLKQPLVDMYHKKSSYLHRAVAPMALACMHKLVNLAGSGSCPSMVHALDHDFFPSAAEIISLERGAGDCLDTYDVCAADAFYNFADHAVDSLVASAERLQEQRQRDRAAAAERGTGIDLSDLDRPGALGRVVSFVATPAAADDAARLPALAALVRRYNHVAYMHAEASEPGGERAFVRCAFSAPAPTQLLRFVVTGQVVPGGGDCNVLYVMSLVSLAKKGTDSRNPDFVAKKRADERRLPASEFYTKRREQREAWRATHTQPSPYERAYRDTSSDDEPGFADAPPYSPMHDALSDQRVDDRGAETHHIGQQRKRLHEQSAAAGKRKLEDAKALDDRYARARSTYETVVARERAEEERLASLRPQDDRPSFSTVQRRTALEDARPLLAPSEARVDDLKEPWKAPQGSVFLQSPTGERLEPMRFAGGRGGIDTQFESVFAEKATDKLQREAEERQREKELWESKVVVDSLQFRVACKQPAAKPHAIDKHKSLLAGEPLKHSLRTVKLENAPVSIREVERTVPNERVEPKASKHPDARRFYYARDAHEKLPKIPAMSPAEKRGPLWGV